MRNIDDYRPIVGDAVVDNLFLLAHHLGDKVIQNINSTATGGGVAEILNRMIPLLNQLGINARWDVIKGGEKFFNITKKFHNALHGVETNFSPDELGHFLEINHQNALEMDLCGDIIFIHDPQPIALIERRPEIGRNWIWRCHIDFSRPQNDLWLFLKEYIEKYDAAVFSAPPFARDLSIPQALIAPSIDPLSDKNRDLTDQEVQGVLESYGIDPEKPIVTQISRFDYLKDPVGVIKAWQLVKKYIDCQLVLAGGGATDDPEGEQVLREVREAANNDKDIFILELPAGSDFEINALVRGSSVVLQKSLKEGFGLTVSEALWKERPVIAGAVGGIPLQITHKYSGILTRSIDGTAFWIKQLLNEPEFAANLAKNGKEHIKSNYLITRHIKDYLLTFLSLFHKDDVNFFH
jgi:trehalose synthase